MFREGESKCNMSLVSDRLLSESYSDKDYANVKRRESTHEADHDN